MKNMLKYYYNLQDIEILEKNNDYLIIDKNNYTYLLKKYEENININYINNILNKIGKSNNYGIILLNFNQSYITKYNDNKYILIKLNGIINEKIELNEIINNTLKYHVLDNKNNLDLISLWSKKIDYLEYQVSSLGKEKKELLNSFSFFIGLAENAISFINVNHINFNNINKSLCHLRIKYNEKVLDYYNPINILIDYEIRDYAEYLKNKILISDDISKDFIFILNNANLSNDAIKLLYARLLFPTFYFDDVEDILLNNLDEKEINKYIDNLPNYLNMLKDIYLEIQKKGISLDIPNWIIKN